jgi:hypothetical protein
LNALPLPTAIIHPEPGSTYPPGATRGLTILSRLLFSPGAEHNPNRLEGRAGIPDFSLQNLAVEDLRSEELAEILALADSHHVLIRALQPFQHMANAAGNRDQADWAASAIQSERVRIDSALSFLTGICSTLEAEGCRVMVIKSLDHWPDLGSDLDLFTSAHPEDVIRVMKQRFGASLARRSWGDRLANKWNFAIPGLKELVEVHVGRLGQTGEHVGVANSLIARRRSLPFGSRRFWVPSPEHRPILSTLQRMYRHFYLRLCDVADTTQLLETDTIDYPYLRSLTQSAGIWKGTATFLAIVSDYVEHFRGAGLDLPEMVRSAAQFGGDQLSFRGFLRIPIMPHSVRLYTSELSSLALRGELQGTLRLSLLPCLATAAVVEQKFTGSDKGIW